MLVSQFLLSQTATVRREDDRPTDRSCDESDVEEEERVTNGPPPPPPLLLPTEEEREMMARFGYKGRKVAEKKFFLLLQE